MKMKMREFEYQVQYTGQGIKGMMNFTVLARSQKIADRTAMENCYRAGNQDWEQWGLCRISWVGGVEKPHSAEQEAPKPEILRPN